MEIRKNDIYNYTVPDNLEEIESRLFKIVQEEAVSNRNISERYLPGTEFHYLELTNIEVLKAEKIALNAKRQFLLDRRSNWKARFVWDIIVPIIVTIITSYLIWLLMKR